MNYSYEILKAEPQHQFLSVRYYAEGRDNYFKNLNNFTQITSGSQILNKIGSNIIYNKIMNNYFIIDRKQSAVIIQKSWRQYKLSKSVRVIQKSWRQYKLSKSARVIQRSWGQYKFSILSNSAKTIQQSWRQYKFRTLSNSAKTIQQSWKQYKLSKRKRLVIFAKKLLNSI